MYFDFLRRKRQKPLPPVTPESQFTIPPQHAELWQKIRDFPIDKPGAQFPLSARLASEQEWPLPYALRVIGEYRKFLFLCMVSPRMVTPSLKVDEAWHLHLLYTKNYWNQLCDATLGRRIDHQPSDGGSAEESKFADLYLRTLDLYAEFFGEPPLDVWGPRKKTS